MLEALALRHGKDLQDRFTSASVAVCGLGGLGSNIAVSLARAGVGHLTLIDFDRVDISNLNRQQYLPAQLGLPKAKAMRDNVLAIAPYCDVRAFDMKLTPDNIAELTQGCTVIAEAFDKPEQKAMLCNFVLEQLPDRYLVAASGMAGLGSSNEITTRRVSRRFYLCGDGKSDVADGLGLVSARVALCAAHQANMILRLIAGETDP